MTAEHEKIHITWDDVEKVQEAAPFPVASPAPAASPPPSPPSAGVTWGTVANHAPTAAAIPTAGGSLLLKGWFYLGAAGLIGAFLAWAICEPSFNDGARNYWGNYCLFPLMVMLMCVGFGVVEGLVERTWQRAFQRGMAALGLGLVLGFVFDLAANLVFAVLTTILESAGADPDYFAANPLFWLSRAFAWMIFGVAGGLVFGTVSRSGKKTVYGILGGVIGAGLGGLLFDPICLITQSAEPSRAIGMSILGACTGVAMGLVESALKDRWLHVAGGPLAGKQFVLYQDHVTIGADPSSTIFLFKDPAVQPCHAAIEHQAGRSILVAHAPLLVSGQLLTPGARHVLRPGDAIAIGRYSFTYSEKEHQGALT